MNIAMNIHCNIQWKASTKTAAHHGKIPGTDMNKILLYMCETTIHMRLYDYRLNTCKGLRRVTNSWNIRVDFPTSWWRHQMETASALLALCEGNSLVIGEFPAQRPLTRGFDVFFDLHPNKGLSKQSSFETPSRSLWRQCNDVVQVSVSCWVRANGSLTIQGPYLPLFTDTTERRAKSNLPNIQYICDYSSMLGLKLNHVSKGCPRGLWLHVVTNAAGVTSQVTHSVLSGFHFLWPMYTCICSIGLCLGRYAMRTRQQTVHDEVMTWKRFPQ